jgi:hypothetical protein
VKGSTAQIDPTFSIHDISHQVTPFNYPQAAYICRNAIWHFRKYLSHYSRLFENKPENLLLARTEGSIFFVRTMDYYT